LLFAVLSAVTVVAAPAQGATITVTTTADEAPPVANGNCTLREAVNAAKSNGSPAVDACTNGDAGSLDTIELGTGTYALTGANGDDANQSGDLDIDARVGMEGPLQIDGAAADVTIDAAFDDRVLQHLTGELTLSDVTVTGGGIAATAGGQGILSTGSHLTLTDVTVTNNSSTLGNGTGGGGINYSPSSLGTLTITDSNITENATNRTGAGISMGNANLELTGSVVANNTVANSNGGGTTGGGGIFFSGPGAATITDSSISGNKVEATGTGGAKITGGGIYFNGSAASRIDHATISGNQVVENQAAALAPAGGGIYHLDTGPGASSPVRVVNSTISSNTVIGDADAGSTAFFGGGAFWSSPNGAITDRIVHSTLAENSSPRGDELASFAFGGGGITLQSSIVDDQDGVVTDTCEGSTILSAGHNVAMGTSCIDGSNLTDLPSTDPGLLPLGGYGGATDTSPPIVGSPAVDLVPVVVCDDGAPAPGLLGSDQRGFPRPFDGDADGNSDCDAGAVEVIPCVGKNATRVGGPAGDVLSGTGEDDVFYGLGGNDTLKGKGGKDRLCGGEGNDSVVGGGGNDTLSGGDGKDGLKGGGGRDKLFGGSGKDRCAGGPDKDRAKGCERKSGIP
jgi:CSLREA domain-containing protein